MPTIVQIGKIKIRIFADDHNPPHFHIVTPDHKISVRISDFKTLAGRMNRHDFDIAMKWAIENQEVLKNEWKRLNPK